MNKEKIRKNLLESYSFLIPTAILIAYVMYIVLGVCGKSELKWVGDSTGFKDMCTLITQFSSIVLGVYGFFIPVIIGKRDSFTDYFWRHINRNRFAKDVHHIILSGIASILLSVILTISDVVSKNIVIVLVGLLVWILIFYVCSTYRFLGIFIQLVVGDGLLKKSDESIQMKDSISDEKKEELNSKLEKF